MKSGCGISSEPLILFYTVIFTINYTILPQLVLHKLCLQQNDFNKTYCEKLGEPSIELQKKSTEWWFYLLTTSLVPAVFTVLIWGPITDIIGRKRAMTLVPIINGIRALVYLSNAYFMEAHVGYMLFGSFLSCLYGEFQGVVALCYAYIADVTSDSPNHRTMRMAFVEASVFFAGVPAGLLSGYLLEKLGFISVFALTFGIDVLTLLYVLIYLPDQVVQPAAERTSSRTSLLHGDDSIRETDAVVENIEKNESANASLNDIKYTHLLNPFSHYKNIVEVLTEPRWISVVVPLTLAFGFSVCAFVGELIVETLYLKNKPFVFSAQEIGYYVAVQGSIRGVGVIIVTQLSHHCFHFNDYTLIIFGLISQITCFLLIGLARTPTVVFLVNIFGLAVSVATATLRSLITKQVLPHQYGSVLASIEAVDAIASVLINAAALWTYNFTLSVYSGVVFFGLSGFSFLSLLLVIGCFCKQKYF